MPCVWPPGAIVSVALGDVGLILGFDTVLAPMTKAGNAAQLALDPERVLALLSVAARRPMTMSALVGIEQAAEYWRRGDEALANLRLIFAGLPRCDAFADAARLQAADWLLAQGMTPRALMKELGLDTAALDAVAGDLAKYNPDQPRVPAGSGAESGRWTNGDFGLGSASASMHFRSFVFVRCRLRRTSPSSRTALSRPTRRTIRSIPKASTRRRRLNSSKRSSTR